MNSPAFHAQYGEDRLLAELFPGKTDGVCAEVGGHDGVTGSNTFYFEQLGWTCVLVEPIPWMYEAIRRNRNCPAFLCAASDREGELSLAVGTGQEQLASLESAVRIRQSGTPVARIKVRARRLDDMLAEAGVSRLDFASIDVEGHEYNVLRGLSLDRFRPRVLIVEASLDRRVERLLNAAGYVRFRVTGVNDWYARPDDPAVNPAEVAELRRQREQAWRALGWRPKVSLALRSVLPAGLLRRLRSVRERLRGSGA